MRSSDFRCDMTDEPISECAVPVVVRITAGTVPGAAVNLSTVELAPFLRELLRAETSRVEMSAESFARAFSVDMDLAGAMFEPDPPSLAAENRALREEIARLRARG